MKNLFLSILILLLTNTLYSQAHRGEYNLGMRQINIEQQKDAYGGFKNLKGSPYVNEVFLLGKVYMGKELAFDNLYLRYNALSDEIEIRNSEENEKLEYGALSKNTDEIIKINNQVYVFVPFENSNEYGRYFEILSEQNTFDLYKKTIVKFQPPVDAITSYDKSKPAEFKKTITYYLVDKKGSFYELPSNKNKILKVLSKDNKKVKAFAKDNNLNLEEDKGLIRLVTFYNSLQ